MSNQNMKKYFGRDSGHRRSLFLNLCVSLIEHEEIKTTLAKAKHLRRHIEPLIAKAAKAPENLAVRRYLIAKLAGNKPAIEKLLKVIGPQSKNRQGGYTRILKCAPRQGDAAPMAYIQLVDMISI